MTVVVRELMQKIVSVGILCEDEARRFLESLDPRPATAADLERELIAAELLTGYQAIEVRAGRTAELSIANHLVLDKIGAGGMGEVFLAKDRSNQRLVAMKKMARDRFGSSEAIERFRREILAIAALEHPNIVKAYDVGRSGKSYFFTMEYVEGQDLSTLVKTRGPTSVARAIEYISQAARGLGYAHQAGLIHRDVKPSNLLVDGAGTVKVLDLGLVLFVRGADDHDGTSLTDAIIGTADFISPEQSRDTHSADARSDIYSLGCTLYWLLTASPPYAGKTAMDKIFAHDSAPIPSLSDLRDDVTPEIDAVFCSMLAKKPEERPQTMQQVIVQLATALQSARVSSIDLAGSSRSDSREALSPPAATIRLPSQSHVEDTTTRLGEEVTVMDTDRCSPVELSDRISRRWLAGAAIVVGAGLIGLAAYWRATKNGSNKVSSSSLDPAVQLNHQATLDPRTGFGSRLSFSRDGGLLAASEGRFLRVWDVSRAIGGAPLGSHSQRIACVDFRPDGSAIASVGFDDELLIWDPATGEKRFSRQSQHGSIHSISYSHDGALLAGGCDDGTVILWDAETVQELRTSFRHGGSVVAVEFARDGRLISAGSDANIHVWDTATFRRLGTLRCEGIPVRSLTMLDDSEQLVSGSGNSNGGEIRLWDLREFKELRRVPYPFAVRSVCAIPIGGSVAISAFENEHGQVFLVGPAEWQPNRLTRSFFDVLDVEYSVGAGRLGFSMGDGSIQLWNLDARKMEVDFRGHCGSTLCLAFSSDGNTLVSAGDQGVIKLWSVPEHREIQTFRRVHRNDILAIALSRDGRRMVSGDRDRKLALWDLTNHDVLATFVPFNGVPAAVYSAAFSPDGSRVVFGGGEAGRGFVHVLNVSRETIERRLIGSTNVVRSVAYSPNGDMIASGGHDGVVQLWKADTDTPTDSFSEHTHAILSVAFSPQGTKLASAGIDQSILVRELESHQTTVLKGHQSDIDQIAFSADGQWLLSVSRDSTFRIWNLDSGEEARRLPLDPHATCFAVSKDSSRLAFGSPNGIINLWRLLLPTPIALPSSAGG